MEIEIKEGSVEEVVAMSRMIPEFENPYPSSIYAERLISDPLILVASIGDRLAGFKVGYDKLSNGIYYSWMGAVLPEFRNHGIAQALLENQESWVKEKGYKGISVKTRNRHDRMINFLLKNKYYIVGVNDQYASPEEFRIVFQKEF